MVPQPDSVLTSARLQHPLGGLMSISTWHSLLALATMGAASLAGPTVANADDRPAADRGRWYAAMHGEIPAFARKYGMRCSACHLAVPALNAFGQAFKDNGYRMKNGTDDLRA